MSSRRAPRTTSRSKRKPARKLTRFRASDHPHRDYRGETTDAKGVKWRI